MNNTNKAGKLRLPKQARPTHTFTVEAGQPEGLLAFLLEVALKDKSRTTVKQLLHDRFISVNGNATTQWDTPLKAGDKVVLHPAPLPSRLVHKHVEIVWQDEHLVLIHKAPGIPTVRSGEERDETALEVVSEHLKKFDPRAKVFLLNRIDKDSAGFVLMARSADLQVQMTEQWEQYVVLQEFAVAIHGQLAQPEGILAPPAVEEETGRKGRKPLRRVSGSTTAGLARYRTLRRTTIGSLLSVTLERGRNNRLRRQLGELKHPIIGDWRNGSPRSDLSFVALETIALGLIHPISGVRYDFDQPISGRFKHLLTEEVSPRKHPHRR